MSTFSSNRRPNLVLTPFKKCSKRRSEFFFGFRKSSFGEHKVVTKDHSIQENPTHRITSHVATIFCNRLAKLLQKIITSQKNQHIASHIATIFCNHLAKLLQKIITSQKTNTSELLLSFVIILQSCYKRS